MTVKQYGYDLMAFSITLDRPEGMIEKQREIEDRYGVELGRKVSDKRIRDKDLAKAMALSDWAETNVTEKSSTVSHARELDPTCHVTTIAAYARVVIDIRFTDPSAAALFKLTWVGVLGR